MTTANKITIFRVICIPVFIVLMYMDGAAARYGLQVLLQEIEKIAPRLLRLLSGPVHGIAAHQDQTQHREDQHPLFHEASPPSAAGHRTVNTDPPPERLAASTVPPRRFTVSLTMDRPRPVPPAARDRALSTR